MIPISWHQTAFILLNEKIPTEVIIKVNNNSTVRSCSKEYDPKCSILFLNASTEYVAGSISVMIFNQVGKLLIGKSAPLRKNSGNTTKLTIN